MIRKFLIPLAVFAASMLSAETLIDSKFDRNAANWYALRNFGTLRHDADNAALHITVNSAGECRIANWKRITPDMCAGKVIKLTAQVRGSGEITPVFVMTVNSASGGRSYPRFAGTPVRLQSDTFTTVEFSLDLASHTPLAIEPRFELKGTNAEAYFSSVKCETAVIKTVKLESDFSYIAFPAGQSGASFRIAGEVSSSLQLFYNNQNREIATDADGSAVIPAAGDGLIRYTVAGNGKSIQLFSEAVAPAEFAALMQAAGNSKLPQGSKVLVLGDSLSDFERGRNYVDQLTFYLNSAGNGEKITFYNFGIGGDDIRRVTRRFIHHFDPKTPDEYFQKRYQGIDSVKYDYVMIFLGQNDTKASSQSNYRTTFVAPAEQLSSYRRLLPELKRRFPEAKIILISPVHSDSARQNAIAEVILQRRDNVWKFGIEEHMERYDAMLKNLAGESGAFYIDLYTPSKNHPSRSTLFQSADGVHLSPAGERFVTLQILLALQHI